MANDKGSRLCDNRGPSRVAGRPCQEHAAGQSHLTLRGLFCSHFRFAEVETDRPSERRNCDSSPAARPRAGGFTPTCPGTLHQAGRVQACGDVAQIPRGSDAALWPAPPWLLAGLGYVLPLGCRAGLECSLRGLGVPRMLRRGVWSSKCHRRKDVTVMQRGETKAF